MNVAVGAVLLAASCGSCASRDPHWIEPRPAPPIEGIAVDTGRPFRLADERPRVVLLTFGYAGCHAACPLTLAKAKAVYAALGARGDDLDFVYVTVDPERDTPDAFRAFLAKTDPRVDGVYPAPRALPSMLEAYQVAVRKRPPDPADYAARAPDASVPYSLDHSAGFWGIDRGGHLRFRYDHDVADVDLVAATRRLIEERS